MAEPDGSTTPAHRVTPAEVGGSGFVERQRDQSATVSRKREHMRDHAAVGEHLCGGAQRIDERVVEATLLTDLPDVSQVRRPYPAVTLRGEGEG